MPTKYHNLVKSGLIELGKELVERKTRFKRVHDGNKKPIRILHPTRKRNPPIINYNPDVYFVTKVDRKFILSIG